MLQKIVLTIAVFIIILVALTFGEALAIQVFSWLSALTGVLIENFGDVYWAVRNYMAAHTNKVVLALLLTIPISIWVLRHRGAEDQQTRHRHRKIAIVLAVFLGWLGAHRFYLGQIGWGVVYLIIFYLFAPLAVILGFIDAIRYLFLTDEDFVPRRL